MQKINFEKSLERLEEITQKLESGELSLDASLKLFEEGIRLSRFCQKKLSETEQKLEILRSNNPEDYDEEDLQAVSEEDGDECEGIQVKEDIKKKKKKTDDMKKGGKENFLF